MEKEKTKRKWRGRKKESCKARRHEVKARKGNKREWKNKIIKIEEKQL